MLHVNRQHDISQGSRTLIPEQAKGEEEEQAGAPNPENTASDAPGTDQPSFPAGLLVELNSADRFFSLLRPLVLSPLLWRS